MRARFLRGHWRTIKRLLGFKKDAEKDGEYRVARRLHAVVLNMEGRTSSEIAAVLKAPRSAVSAWLGQYADHGLEGLLEGQRAGRPCALTPEARAALADLVESGPVAYGFLSGVWTSPMIARVIQDEFGVAYHPGHVRKLLHALGFSVQRPQRTLARADATQRSRWKRYTYPNIKKKPTRSRRP